MGKPPPSASITPSPVVVLCLQFTNMTHVQFQFDRLLSCCACSAHTAITFVSNYAHVFSSHECLLSHTHSLSHSLAIDSVSVSQQFTSNSPHITHFSFHTTLTTRHPTPCSLDHLPLRSRPLHACAVPAVPLHCHTSHHCHCHRSPPVYLNRKKKGRETLFKQMRYKEGQCFSSLHDLNSTHTHSPSCLLWTCVPVPRLPSQMRLLCCTGQPEGLLRYRACSKACVTLPACKQVASLDVLCM